jgi:MbtH protein
MASPFEDEDAAFAVLINDEGQYSLWPAFVEVPAGWTEAFRAKTKAPCLDYVERHWTDMRPKSLIDALQQPSTS